MRLNLLWLALGVLACDGGRDPDAEPITVFAAASLARPLAALADSFHAETGVAVRRELGGSLELARRMTELGRVPDVLMLADDAVIASLVPAHLDWYVRFATSPLVIAYRSTSRHAGEITADNWWRILASPGVTIGHADSAIAPAGRHALALIRQAEDYYDQPGLTQRLMGNAPLGLVRPNATELAVLLETGEVDFILEYEAVARQYGFEFVALPRDMPAAVVYGLSIPRAAPDSRAAIDFAMLVLSGRGKGLLRDAHVTALRTAVAVGANVPAEIAELVRTLSRPAEP